MKQYIYFFIVGGVTALVSCSSTFALTPKEQKGVKVLKASHVVYESPTRFTPVPLTSASEDIADWIGLLPYTGARDHDTYVVIPTLGLITPVVLIPEGVSDYTAMTQGRSININTYLVSGVLHYPGTAMPGQLGNMVIFGHSNYLKNGVGDYKTIFADIMNLDVGPYDEIRIYQKQQDAAYNTNVKIVLMRSLSNQQPRSTAGDEIEGSRSSSGSMRSNRYKLFKYRIERSYETHPTDVDILLPTTGEELTVFACTNGIAGRWIIKAARIHDDEVFVPYEMKFRWYEAISKLALKEPEVQEAIRNQILTQIERSRIRTALQVPSAKTENRLYLLEYLEKELLAL